MLLVRSPRGAYLRRRLDNTGRGGRNILCGEHEVAIGLEDGLVHSKDVLVGPQLVGYRLS